MTSLDEIRMTNLISKQAASDALDSLDDFARMECGVDAIGPRGVLERFIEQAGDPTASRGPLTTGNDALAQVLADIGLLKQEAEQRASNERLDEPSREKARATVEAYRFCELRIQQRMNS